ncbi:MAG: methyltransferase domain-containing protein [Helicobacter sp.]|nr:methyltransferase domain-containing protein [Helicobacter sp.]
MPKDELFKQDLNKQFQFDSNVASVFDDMASRSIPFYAQTIEICCDFALFLNTQKELSVLDLGSATGNFLLNLAPKLKDSTLFGIDNSKAMIDIASQKSRAYGFDISFILDDITQNDFKAINKNGFDLITALWTVQFVRPLLRQKLLAKIHASLKNDSFFIMSEKLYAPDPILDFWIIKQYENFKQNAGYSKNEIAKKREAIQNVLVSYSSDENVKMLKDAGFSSVEVVLRYLNFATFIARK